MKFEHFSYMMNLILYVFCTIYFVKFICKLSITNFRNVTVEFLCMLFLCFLNTEWYYGLHTSRDYGYVSLYLVYDDNRWENITFYFSTTVLILIIKKYSTCKSVIHG